MLKMTVKSKKVYSNRNLFPMIYFPHFKKKSS